MHDCVRSSPAGVARSRSWTFRTRYPAGGARRRSAWTSAGVGYPAKVRSRDIRRCRDRGSSATARTRLRDIRTCQRSAKTRCRDIFGCQSSAKIHPVDFRRCQRSLRLHSHDIFRRHRSVIARSANISTSAGSAKLVGERVFWTSDIRRRHRHPTNRESDTRGCLRYHRTP